MSFKSWFRGVEDRLDRLFNLPLAHPNPVPAKVPPVQDKRPLLVEHKAPLVSDNPPSAVVSNAKGVSTTEFAASHTENRVREPKPPLVDTEPIVPPVVERKMGGMSQWDIQALHRQQIEGGGGELGVIAMNNELGIQSTDAFAINPSIATSLADPLIVRIAKPMPPEILVSDKAMHNRFNDE